MDTTTTACNSASADADAPGHEQIISRQTPNGSWCVTSIQTRRCFCVRRDRLRMWRVFEIMATGAEVGRGGGFGELSGALEWIESAHHAEVG